MKNNYFQSLEKLKEGETLAFKEIIEALNFDHNGLIPVVTQDSTSKEVLMLAWMSKISIKQTLITGQMTYWSRSRQQLWVKGETSGHFQTLKSMRIDCDGDSILCRVEQTGAACHTGRNNCFYFNVDIHNQAVSILSSPL